MNTIARPWRVFVAALLGAGGLLGGASAAPAQSAPTLDMSPHHLNVRVASPFDAGLAYR